MPHADQFRFVTTWTPWLHQLIKDPARWGGNKKKQKKKKNHKVKTKKMCLWMSCLESPALAWQSERLESPASRLAWGPGGELSAIRRRAGRQLGGIYDTVPKRISRKRHRALVSITLPAKAKRGGIVAPLERCLQKWKLECSFRHDVGVNEKVVS